MTSKPNNQTSSTNKDNPTSVPLHSTTQQQQQQQQRQGQTGKEENLLENALKSIFGTCIGAVDMASYLLQSTCRGDDHDAAAKEKGKVDVPVLKLKKPLPKMRVKRRQGDTLEFPSNGGFDDEISAISALTLEEMERLQIFRKNATKKGRSAAASAAKKTTTTPIPEQEPGNQNDMSWAYEMKRPNSISSNPSLGVSTSGSGSSSSGGEGNPKIKKKTTPRNPRMFDI